MNIIDMFYENKIEENAVHMAAYMKNKFSFLGISRPKRNELQKTFLKEAKKGKFVDWEFIFKCWDLPEREFQYLAMDYIVTLQKYLLENDIEKIEKLITNKSWWDTVDVLAGKIAGQFFSRFPRLIDKYILEWSVSENIWLKRTAILFQLKYKEKTDIQLLKKVILQNKDTKEFFINKAIGWALREYSKTNKKWVRSFIANNSLHSLSVREGSKYT